MAWLTAGEILNDAAVELGLVATRYDDPFNATDQAVVQLCQFLKTGGRELVDEHNWSHLRGEYVFTTTGTYSTLSAYVCGTSAAVIPVGTLLTGSASYSVNPPGLTLGAVSAWGPRMYAAGELVTSGGRTYVCVTSDTSPPTTPPSGTGSAIADDGGGVWAYLGTGGYAGLISCTAVTPGVVSSAAGTVTGFATTIAGVQSVTQISSGSTGVPQTSYDLPADWRDMMDQTGWNRTTRLPLGGPLSPQEWQFLKSRMAGVVFTVLFRPMLQKLYLYPDTSLPMGHVISMEYESSNWAGASGATSPTKDSCSAGADIVFFDAKMVLAKVKLKWLEAKGFDTSVAERDYRRAFEAAKSNDIAAPVLNLDRPSMRTVDVLLGDQNIPVTGFGS